MLELFGEMANSRAWGRKVQAGSEMPLLCQGSVQNLRKYKNDLGNICRELILFNSGQLEHPQDSESHKIS